MDHGRIVQVGTPADIYESPATRFVADFIGSVNMFEGRVSEQGADFVRIECAELGCTVRAERGVNGVNGVNGVTRVDRDSPGEDQHQPRARGRRRRRRERSARHGA